MKSVKAGRNTEISFCHFGTIDLKLCHKAYMEQLGWGKKNQKKGKEINQLSKWLISLPEAGLQLLFW